MSRKNKILLAINICNVILLLGCLISWRHTLIRKFNEATEKPVIEMNLTMNKKLEDFEYFYNSIATSLPIDTLEGIEELYGIDFVERYDMYHKLISSTENDLEFFAVMRAIGEEIPTFHAGLAYPDYEYYETLDCWNIESVLDKRGIRSKATYWNDLLKKSCKEYLEKSPIIYRYDYNTSMGAHLASNKEVLLSINGIEMNLYAKEISPKILTYDHIHDNAYRKSYSFFDKPYSGNFAKEVVIKYKTQEGQVCERTVYMDLVAEVVLGYAEALGVTIEEEKRKTVADNMFYSYLDKEHDILYMYISTMSRWALSEVPMVLESAGCENIIIDLRNNGGGYTKSIGECLYPSLFKEDIKVTDTWYLPDTKYTKKMVTDRKSYKELKLKRSKRYEKDGLGNKCQYLQSNTKINWRGNESMENPYNIYLLISQETGSAADGFVGILKENVNVTILGTNTGGEGRMSSFLVDYLDESGLLYVYMPELGINADGSNNAVVGTAPHIYVEEGYLDDEIYYNMNEDPYLYENRLMWDNVLLETLNVIMN